MNQDTQKQFALKLLTVSTAACAGWMFLIKPVHAKVQQHEQQIKSHTALIQAHDTQVQESDTGKTIEIENQLNAIFDQLSLSKADKEAGTDLHSRIHASAAKFGVSVSRIESVNTREIKEQLNHTNTHVVAMSNTVRVEFEGDYSSLLGFMDDLVTTNIPIKYTSFRMIPIGHETVRVNAEIDSVVLTSIPSGTNDGGAIDE